MKYMIRSGVLYTGDSQMLAKIKGSIYGPEKQIFRADGVLSLTAEIRKADASDFPKGDVRAREYCIFDLSGAVVLSARPGYAKDEEPDSAGWPVCRMPRADHALVQYGDGCYRLIMHNSQNYSMTDDAGKTVLQILHQGICGGWQIETDLELPCELLCGIFVLCRYIEQENEFHIV